MKILNKFFNKSYNKSFDGKYEFPKLIIRKLNLFIFYFIYLKYILID
jgi:hypothetical protein